MKKNFLIVLIALVLIGGGIWYVSQSQTGQSRLVAGESVSNWDFTGVYTGNTELEARAEAEIERLEGLFGEEGSSEYELYVSIANQYDLLGDGKKEYEYLNKALALDSERTGLAWNNLARLFEKLGAYKSALQAFDAAVAAQPSLQNQEARLDFLRTRMPENTAAIAQAEAQLRDTAGDLDFVE